MVHVISIYVCVVVVVDVLHFKTSSKQKTAKVRHVHDSFNDGIIRVAEMRHALATRCGQHLHGVLQVHLLS